MEKLWLYNTTIFRFYVDETLMKLHFGEHVSINLIHKYQFMNKLRRVEASQFGRGAEITTVPYNRGLLYEFKVLSSHHHETWKGPWDLYFSFLDNEGNSTFTIKFARAFCYVDRSTGGEGSRIYSLNLADQGGAIVLDYGCYVGFLSNADTGFVNKNDFKFTSLTGSILQNAIINGSLAAYELEPQDIELVSTANRQLFLLMVPEFTGYQASQFDGLFDFVEFSADPDQFSNGSIIEMGDVRYKMYGQYAPIAGTEFNIRLE